MIELYKIFIIKFFNFSNLIIKSMVIFFHKILNIPLFIFYYTCYVLNIYFFGIVHIL